MKQISLDQVLILHEDAIEDTGGEIGIRDIALLESAVWVIYQTFGGNDLFPSIHEKAARLAFGIAMNHPFVDGNKRTAAGAMLALLIINDVSIAYTQQELSSLFLCLAKGESCYEDILAWIHAHLS